ncbi:MAG TPA: hypothetical protein VI916_07825 [Acidimicrobiia bacterium]|nr:hypothetical protein [Acidimicrobiia bacterium]
MERARWIRGPRADSVVAWCWVPLFLVAWTVVENADATNALLLAAFGLSFIHQPLTLALVYGDPEQFAEHRRLFAWSPVVFVLAVVVGVEISPALVAAVAGLWNAEHTLMQRFGLVRVYGRKVGEDSDGAALERWMLLSWLGLALVWVAASKDTAAMVSGLALGDRNGAGVDLLTSTRPMAQVLLLPMVAVVVGLTARWVRVERARGADANPAKHLYVASTAALFVTMLLWPVPGFIAYIGSHALEYFAVVDHALGRRYLRRDGGALGIAVRRFGGTWVVAGLVAVTLAAYMAVGDQRYEGAMGVVVLTAGGLHVFYDGFIWKLRRAPVADSLDIPRVSVATRV